MLTDIAVDFDTRRPGDAFHAGIFGRLEDVEASADDLVVGLGRRQPGVGGWAAKVDDGIGASEDVIDPGRVTQIELDIAEAVGVGPGV